MTARTGEGELRTLRMKHRALRSGITPLTDRRQGSDRIAPKEGAAIFSQKTYLTENVQLSKQCGCLVPALLPVLPVARCADATLVQFLMVKLHERGRTFGRVLICLSSYCTQSL